MKEITLGSLFDGSGGFPLAAALHGCVPLWASEVEPYPIAVTHSRFPNMKHLGNVSEIHGDKIDPVDIITFGSPCQDMSTAGKRAGMKHVAAGDEETTRSGLFYEAIRIIREMRDATNGKYPTFAVWENVPGAFSSNKGEDFRCVLEEFARVKERNISIPQPTGGWTTAGEVMGDGYSIAWRVLDAQYWGVPQRRRRIYLVADFAGGRAGKILFERKSVPRHPAQSGETRESTATDAEGSVGGGTGFLCGQGVKAQLPIEPSVCNESGHGYWMSGFGCLRAEGENRPSRPCHLVCFPQNQRDVYHATAFMAGQGAKARSIAAAEDCAPTLKASPSGLNQAPSVVYPVVHPTLTAQNAANVESAQRFNGVVYPATAHCYTPTRFAEYQESLPTLRASGADCGGGSEGIAVSAVDATLCMATGQANAEIMENRSPTLVAGHEQPIVALNSKPPRRYIVRRLTPTECARLQGFPDGWGTPEHRDAMISEEVAFWEGVRKTHSKLSGKTYKPCERIDTLLKWYNKLHSDSSEYKMWGNGLAFPCAEFVVSGIVEELKKQWKN